MKFKTSILILFVATFFSLSSCQKQYRTYSKIELLDGEFVTPLGTFDVELLSTISKKNGIEVDDQNADNFFLFASDEMVEVDFATVPNLRSNRISYDLSLGKTLELRSIKYSMDNDAYNISFGDLSKGGSGYLSDKLFYQKEIVDKSAKPISHESYSYWINFPTPLLSHAHSIDAESYKKHNSRVHKVEITFLLDKKPYLLAFKYKHILVRESFYAAPFAGVSP